MVGTKWPSMTSRWRYLAPAARAFLASDAREAMSQSRTEGPIWAGQQWYGIFGWLKRRSERKSGVMV